MTFARQTAGSLVALCFGIVVSVVLSRLLGPEGRGAYGLAVKLSGLMLAVVQWGIPEVLLQFMGDQPGRSGALFGTTLVLGLVATAILAGVTYLAYPLLADNLLRGVSRDLVALALIGSAPALIGLLARRMIQLDGRIDRYVLLDIARNVVFVVLTGLLGIVLLQQALGALVAYLVAETLVAFVACWQVWTRHRRWPFDRRLAGALLVAGIPVQVGVLATYVGNESGSFVLNVGLDLAAVGVYAVALSVARLVIQISMALRTVMAPRLIAAGSDPVDVTVQVTRHGVLAMVVVACGLGLGAPLVPLVFGAGFGQASWVLVLMLPGMVAYGVSQILAVYLHRIGKRGLLAISSWSFVVASIAFQVLGVRAAGLLGAALGLTLAYGAMMAIELLGFSRYAARPLPSLLPRLADLAVYWSLARHVASLRPGVRPSHVPN